MRMRIRQWGRCFALAATVVSALTVVAVPTATPAGLDNGGCEQMITDRVVSPDGAWEAVVDEFTCEAGPMMTSITAEVQLIAAHDPARATDVLGVDTGGHVDERPRLVWVGADVLQVTVPNLSYLKVLATRIGGVRVDVRFDPDDPATRAAWLREHALPPDQLAKH